MGPGGGEIQLQTITMEQPVGEGDDTSLGVEEVAAVVDVADIMEEMEKRPKV